MLEIDINNQTNTIHSSILDCVGNTPLVHLKRLFTHYDIDVLAKLEFMNPGGSMKDRPARYIIEKGLKDGSIRPGSHIFESTSGNLGVAISMVARVYDLNFTCVVDPKITKSNLKLLKKMGANVEMVNEPDNQGGYLKTRIKRVKELLNITPNGIWINQYANRLNWEAHYNGTGNEIVEQANGPIDYLVAAVSTTGSIIGSARRLRQAFPKIRIIAVDAVGSVIFGTPPSIRELPGIGSSRVPEIFSPDEIDEVIHINDRESVQGCLDLLYYEGIFAGGSSGSVVSAVKKLIPTIPLRSRIAVILPDRGDRYLDMVYDDEWVEKLPQYVL